MLLQYKSGIMFILLLSIFTLMAMASAKLPDGKIAKKFDEFSSPIKCMLNIAEAILPELTTFMNCCGFWAFTDFLMHQVEAGCTKYDLDKLQHVLDFVVPKARENCSGYEQGSFTCRLLVIIPITFAILFILLITSICACSCISFYKWIRVRRKYRQVRNRNFALESYNRNSYDYKVSESKPHKTKPLKGDVQI